MTAVNGLSHQTSRTTVPLPTRAALAKMTKRDVWHAKDKSKFHRGDFVYVIHEDMKEEDRSSDPDKYWKARIKSFHEDKKTKNTWAVVEWMYSFEDIRVIELSGVKAVHGVRFAMNHLEMIEFDDSLAILKEIESSSWFYRWTLHLNSQNPAQAEVKGLNLTCNCLTLYQPLGPNSNIAYGKEAGKG
ncbi:hypothetical protein BDN72DRAFT_905510 [Pluteus cervinus]|uniref:Uncharacterized protein n=1 Tax=Pluteus cervinus TaxID=181527 RepID=A0ACD3A3F9_9AGAR|nr:hypothetical protein BDN72DRAFT_905510 [Pluteus cervinus]